MLRFRLLSLVCLGSLVLGSAAEATPVTATVDKWRNTDGNFAFSAIHGATSAATTIDGARYWMSGSIDYKVDPAGLLTGDLTGGVLSASGTVGLLSGDTLFLDGVIDFSVAAGALMGTFNYELTTATFIEQGTFYFFNYAFSSGSCDANGLCGDTYRLWGNNWNNQLAGLTQPGNNVQVSTDGGATFSLASAHRGVDLGGVIAPVPEPHSALLYGIGILVVGSRIRKSSAS